ncbi:MAG: hypothetical protein GY800_02445 [Planctomycetes bacterium]|nr:hypothetical protein [Planctomycetota bacterium]
MRNNITKKWFRRITIHTPHLGLGPSSQSAGSRNGFTFITVLIVLAMLGVAAGVALVFVSQLRDIRRERMSRDELVDLRQAITGNPRLIIKDGRADFGYIGSMGSLPSGLEDLYKKSSQPSYVFNTTKKVGAGWKGPYIAPLIIEQVDSLKQDPFRNDYVYSTAQYTRSDGEVVVAKITSIGKDGTEGNSDDRSVEVLEREAFATITGAVTKTNGNPQINTPVVLNMPENGALTEQFDVTDASGEYSFSDVPFGLRSVQVGPRISYVDGTAEAVSGNNDDLQFKIVNMSQNDVTLSSLKAVYAGTMFYERILWAGAIVWRYDTDGGGVRGASGETKTWSSSKTINGTGQPTEAKIIRVEESSTTVPTIILQPSGATKTLKLLNFRDVQTGPGSMVNVGSVTFTMTFSDGSTMTFTSDP